MNFSCLSKEEVRRKYERATDKHQAIEVIAGLTDSTKREVKKFLGLKTIPKTPRREHGNIDSLLARKLHTAGFTDGEIAATMGVTSSAVGIWRRKFGLDINRLKTPEETKRLVLYNAGLNDAEVGRALGLSPSAIHSWRKRRDLPPNTSRGGYRPRSEIKRVEPHDYDTLEEEKK